MSESNEEESMESIESKEAEERRRAEERRVALRDRRDSDRVTVGPADRRQESERRNED